MSLCRIVALQGGVDFQAKDSSGVWRRLAEGDAIADGESLKVIADGPRFGVAVCTVQNRVSGAWADAFHVELDLAQGMSYTRTDVLAITGDATDSAVTISVTHAKGSAPAKHAHAAQLHTEKTRGLAFKFSNDFYQGVLSAVSTEKDPTAGGYYEEIDARLVCNREQFAKAGTMPIAGQVVVIEQTRHTIASVETGDSVFTFDLRRDRNA